MVRAKATSNGGYEIKCKVTMVRAKASSNDGLKAHAIQKDYSGLIRQETLNVPCDNIVELGLLLRESFLHLLKGVLGDHHELFHF